MRKEIRLWPYRILGVLVLLGLWELVVGLQQPSLRLAELGKSIVTFLPSPVVVESLVISLRRILIGFSVGAALGIAVGLLLGTSRWARTLTDPIWDFLRPIAPLAWVPLSIVWFGLTEQAAVFVIAYASFFPTMLNTATGVGQVPQTYREAALTLGANRLAIARYVVIPSAFPFVLSGLRISLGLSWAVIVAAEMIVGGVLQAGIGYLLIQNTMVYFDMSRVLALVVLVGALAFVIDRGLRWIAGRLTPWKTA